MFEADFALLARIEARCVGKARVAIPRKEIRELRRIAGKPRLGNRGQAMRVRSVLHYVREAREGLERKVISAVTQRLDQTRPKLEFDTIRARLQQYITP